MKSVLDYLERAATLSPDKTAVSYMDRQYTFSELRETARQIGATLNGFQLHNEPIGVIADRGIETISFFLGVLYSGNFYVPIDPEIRAEKRAALFEDARFSVILGLPQQCELLEEINYQNTFLTMEDIESRQCPLPPIEPDDPMYMVYTSGSSGKPKGVLKSHRAMISFVEAYCDTFSFSESEIIGNQTPFFFDASAKDIYLMLKLGCSMEILPTSIFTLPPVLIDYLNQKRVTFASWVPTVLSIVAQLNPFSMVKPTTLKKVFFVGEVMPMKHLNKWRAALPEIEYVNLYGQSEIAGVCCYYRVEGTFCDSDVLPIGTPLRNSSLYLLDGEEIIHAPNCIGELYIVSDALAMRYFHDPDKTAASFVVRDFGAGPVRCFKTGDLARYDECGNLLFAARGDYQIKHMGHRIELGEIEAAACSLEEIDRCCCLYCAEKRKIILFCQEAKDRSLSGTEIRSKLRQKLSDYMIPGKVIVLDSLPLNANGKIDRQALKSMM